MLENRAIAMIHCGREISAEEISQIQETVGLCRGLSRKELAQTIAEHLQWYRASGTNKEDACIKLLQKLELKGVLQLPAKRRRSKTGVESANRISAKTDPQPAIVCPLKQLGAVALEVVKDKDCGKLWQQYVARYHYLGYKKPFGYTLRYFIKSDRGRLGCILYSGAAKCMGARERWIGWTDNQRLRNLPWVINNSRYLIFPWVKVRNLASHVLGQISRQIRGHWQEIWGYAPVLMETFVDPQHYQGSCYQAANWQYIGMTTGQGLVRAGKRYQTSAKKIFLKPLVKNYRELLCSQKLVGRAAI
jgi:hypothetical protein